MAEHLLVAQLLEVLLLELGLLGGLELQGGLLALQHVSLAGIQDLPQPLLLQQLDYVLLVLVQGLHMPSAQDFNPPSGRPVRIQVSRPESSFSDRYAIN